MKLYKGVKPIKSVNRDNTGEHYWSCPNCKTRVGGFIITGKGEDDWGYEEDKFCKECGAKINWNLMR